MFTPEIENRIAEEFDCLKDVVFLSASFTTMPPRCVQNVFPAYLDTWLHTLSNEKWEEWIVSEQEKARKEAAKLLHCGSGEIAFVKNTTEGIGIIASGYPWTPGKNIVIPDVEHYANLHSWIPLTDRGVVLKPVSVTAREKGMTAEALMAAVDDDTMAVVTSVIQYSDGAFVDMEKLGRFCSEKGILLIVDAIQAVGRMDVDVKKWGISWLSCGSHKGLFSLESGGIVYCCPEILEKIVPPYNGMSGTSKRSRISEEGGMKVHYLPDARRFESGSVNTLGCMCIAEACRLLCSIGMDEVEEHILDLERLCLSYLDSRAGIRTAGDRLGGIIMVDFAAENRDKVLAILEKYRINATVRPDNVRCTISLVNRAEHMRILADAIKEIQLL